MVFAMPKVSSDLERRGEEGGTVVSHSSQPAADGTPHRRIVLVAWPQFGVAVLLDIETGHRGTRSAEIPRLSDGITLCFQK